MVVTELALTSNGACPKQLFKQLIIEYGILVFICLMNHIYNLHFKGTLHFLHHTFAFLVYGVVKMYTF